MLRKHLCRVGCTAALVILLCGCRKKENNAAEAAEAVRARGDQLYQVYITGTPDQARQSLKEAIQIHENPALSPPARATGLYLTYSRLFVLEKRSGNESLAEAAFAKARELRLAQGVSAATDFTPEKCLSEVDQWDNKNTAGKGPAYLSFLPAGRQPTSHRAEPTTAPSGS